MYYRTHSAQFKESLILIWAKIINFLFIFKETAASFKRLNSKLQKRSRFISVLRIFSCAFVVEFRSLKSRGMDNKKVNVFTLPFLLDNWWPSHITDLLHC